MTHRIRLAGVILLVAAIVGLPACSKKKEPANRVDVRISEASLARVNAKLAAADALDGTADKVVARCAGCALSMDGKRSIVLAVGDYDVCFCSEHCRDNFAPQAEEKVLALDVPGYREPDPDADEDDEYVGGEG